MLKRLVNWLQPKPKIKPKGKSVDSSAIKTRIETQGWKIIEIPIKKNDPDPSKRLITQWKFIATKGDKSIEVRGGDKDSAWQNLGSVLGVIAKP